MSISISGIFQYTLPTSNYISSNTPIINTNGSFSKLDKLATVSGSNTIVTFDFIFTDNGSLVDGLYFNGSVTTTTNMTINDSALIPLSRQGSQFKEYV
jgi:hypothetical protein